MLRFFPAQARRLGVVGLCTLGIVRVVWAQPAGAPTATNIATARAVRQLSPEVAAQALPVRIQAIVTYVFDTHNAFVQDATAGIYIGDGAEFPVLTAGDLVELQGRTGPGEFAPMIRPTGVRLLGHTNLPAPEVVGYEELLTGRRDSQWVEVSGLVRAVYPESGGNCVMEIAAGSGRLTVYLPLALEQDAAALVDSQVRVKGVCGTWFNKQRQLFGVRLMVAGRSDILVMEEPQANQIEQTAQPIGSLMRFNPDSGQAGRRAKVAGTVTLHQPGRALYIQDEMHGLYVQTRQAGQLQPGDQVELIGFPGQGDYTPILQDGVWKMVGRGVTPVPAWIKPDDALGGLFDARLVAIEARLLDRMHNYNETVLVLEAEHHIFAARLDASSEGAAIAALQNGSRLRVTGVCQIEVGDAWRAGPAWRAKSFQLLLRRPEDVTVIALPPWWNLRRLLWTVALLLAAVLASLAWAAQLRQKVGKQTAIIRSQLENEATLKERYQDLFENANDMVYTQELAGRITSVNVAGERILGRERQSIVGKNILEFVVAEQRSAVAQWMEHILDGTAPATVEWEFVHRVGHCVRLEISTRLIERDGQRVEVEGIARDVTERRRLEKEILEISTREQRRIGHDLHDGVCQQLAGIGMKADILADKLKELGQAEASEADNIADLVNKANKQTRAVARGLFPVRLEENGLSSALEELAENAATFFKTECRCECPEPLRISDHSVAHHLYYIAQEAIGNAVRHGKARHISITARETGVDRGLLLVQDDGCGLPPPQENVGMGIRIMNYRARLIGATIQVRNGTTGGVEVECRFPLEVEVKAAPAAPDGAAA